MRLNNHKLLINPSPMASTMSWNCYCCRRCWCCSWQSIAYINECASHNLPHAAGCKWPKL